MHFNSIYDAVECQGDWLGLRGCDAPAFHLVYRCDVARPPRKWLTEGSPSGAFYQLVPLWHFEGSAVHKPFPRAQLLGGKAEGGGNEERGRGGRTERKRERGRSAASRNTSSELRPMNHQAINRVKENKSAAKYEDLCGIPQ